MKIFNTQVYGLVESMIRSGYPMSTDVKYMPHNYRPGYAPEQDAKRAIKLGNAKPGSGHDCFLKGIIVQADIEAPQHWWLQWSRYHFQDIISSQSKMHRIIKMDIEKQCTHRVRPLAIQNLQNCIAVYMADPTPENFEMVLDNTPSGLQLTAGITTNYLQLKTEHSQRKNHRLSGWNKVFREWCEGLPMFKELCLGGGVDGR